MRLRPKGQVTVPAKQLAMLDLRAGDQLISRIEGDRIVLGPAEVTRRGPRFEPPVELKPTPAQLRERRRVLAKLRPLSAKDLAGLKIFELRGGAFTDAELEVAIAEGRE